MQQNESIIKSALDRLEPNQRVMFVWSGKQIPADFQSVIERLQEKVGKETKISVEHSDRLAIGNHDKSTFDSILSNLLTIEQANHDAATISQYLKLLKPKGQLLVFENKAKAADLSSELKLNGFLNISDVSISDDANNNRSLVYAEKPNFELGSASKLKFASKIATSAVDNKAKVWQFSQNDIQEDDLINTDDLLDELDLKKPTPLDKFDCGTSKEGKKKACKNCSCGLAEELEKDASEQQKKNVETAGFKSACGSCYLGDAFRCASCPYLGMPAFKPGEKVQLNENFIKSDI
jgi:hypothetical protein